MLGDAFVAVLALYAAVLLTHHGAVPEIPLSRGLILTAVAIVTDWAIFVAMGMYRRLWRYASMRDLLRVVIGVTAAQVLQVVLLAALSVPLSLYVRVLDWLLVLAGIGCIRLLFRLRDDVLMTPPGSRSQMKRVLVVGAGRAGAMVVRDIWRDRRRRYYPVGLVDDDTQKQGMEIDGVPVRGMLKDVAGLVDRLGIDEVITAIPSASRAMIHSLLETCRRCRIPLRIVPGIGEMIDGRTTISRIRDVRVEDLLGREPVQLDVDQIADYLHGKRVLITGAGGSIGSEICRQVSEFGPELLILLGRGENSIFEIEQEMRLERPDVAIYPVIGDIRDQALVTRVFSELRPQVVFHAAAHKHVPLMEGWPEEAVKNNIFGTYQLVKAAETYGVKRFVLVSTDKAVNPTSIMGATKRVAELIMQSYARRENEAVFAAVRFGNVLGSRGSVVPHFQKQILRGGPVTVTHPDMTRYFMTIPEAVQLVIQAGSMARGGEIFVLDMGEPVRIVDLAENMIRLSGLEPGRDIEIVFTGIRPGEKLYEEILTAEEGTRATKNSRIFVSNMPAEAGKKVDSVRERFWPLMEANDYAGVTRLIEEMVLVPEAREKRRQARAAKDEAAATGA